MACLNSAVSVRPANFQPSLPVTPSKHLLGGYRVETTVGEVQSAVVADDSAISVPGHTTDGQETGDGEMKAAGSVLLVGETADLARLVRGDGAMELLAARPWDRERRWRGEV